MLNTLISLSQTRSANYKEVDPPASQLDPVIWTRFCDTLRRKSNPELANQIPDVPDPAPTQTQSRYGFNPGSDQALSQNPIQLQRKSNPELAKQIPDGSDQTPKLGSPLAIATENVL